MENGKDPIESLKQGLYGRINRLPKIRRSRLSPNPVGTAQNWSQAKSYGGSWFTVRFLKRVFLLAVIFFVLTLIVATWVFYRGSNTVSTSNLNVLIDGPASIRAGEIATFQIKIENNNAASLESADLVIEYPSGTLSVDRDGEPLTRERLPLGDIGAGQTETRSVKAILFGARDSELEVKATVEYRLAGSNAIFDKTTTYLVAVSSTPVVLAVDLPPEINTGQDAFLNIEAVSNSETLLDNTVILVTYPPGFSFSRATPAPTDGNNQWRINRWAAGEKKTIKITGQLEGQDDEQKVFRIEAGVLPEPTATELSVVYGVETKTIALRRPYITVSASINGDSSPDLFVSSKEILWLDIDWQNNLPTEITDGEILVSFSGSALDKATVDAEDGFYQSINNSILWNGDSHDALQSIAPGAVGKVRATFSTIGLNSPENAAIRNPEIGLKIEFRGRRNTEDNEREVITSEISKKVRINSVMQLAAKALHRSGAFTNSGPLPPKVDSETTYTIVWSVINYSNDVNGVTARATLPPYIKWLDKFLPTNEQITFVPNDSGGGEVIWNLETVRAGTGTVTPAREISFQIGFLPSLSQVGSKQELVGPISISGVDSFTKQTLTPPARRALDTYLVSDPGFQFGEDKVVN